MDNNIICRTLSHKFGSVEIVLDVSIVLNTTLLVNPVKGKKVTFDTIDEQKNLRVYDRQKILKIVLCLQHYFSAAELL